MAVLCRDEPDLQLAARRGSPVTIGLGDGEAIIASDVAIVAHTNRVTWLEDDEIVVVTRPRLIHAVRLGDHHHLRVEPGPALVPARHEFERCANWEKLVSRPLGDSPNWRPGSPHQRFFALRLTSPETRVRPRRRRATCCPGRQGTIGDICSRGRDAVERSGRIARLRL